MWDQNNCRDHISCSASPWESEKKSYREVVSSKSGALYIHSKKSRSHVHGMHLQYKKKNTSQDVWMYEIRQKEMMDVCEEEKYVFFFLPQSTSSSTHLLACPHELTAHSSFPSEAGLKSSTRSCRVFALRGLGYGYSILQRATGVSRLWVTSQVYSGGKGVNVIHL